MSSGVSVQGVYVLGGMCPGDTSPYTAPTRDARALICRCAV